MSGSAWPVRSPKDKRYFAFEVMHTVLGGGFTGRITQTLREKMGIIYHAYMKQDWRRHGGPFVLDVAIDTPETARGIQTLIAMYGDLSKTPVPAAELEKAKQNLIRALPLKFDTNAETATMFAELAIHGVPDAFYASYVTNVGKDHGGRCPRRRTGAPARGPARVRRRRRPREDPRGARQARPRQAGAARRLRSREVI